MTEAVRRFETRILNGEWVKALETYNLILAAETVLKPFLIRKESRGNPRREITWKPIEMKIYDPSRLSPRKSLEMIEEKSQKFSKPTNL